MKKSKEINEIVMLARKIVELNQKAFLMIEPVIREAMASGIQDLEYLGPVAWELED